MDLSKRDISQTEINRRKKVSAFLTRTTSGAGLAAAGTLVAGAAAPKLVGTKAGKYLKLTEEGTKKFKESTSSKAGVATITAGGVAGLNGFNNATIQSGEAKQRKRNAVKKPVIKSASPFEEGYFGEVSKYYDPEGNRKKRADLYENAAAAGAGAAGAGAIHQGVQANRALKGSRSRWGGKNPKVVYDAEKLKAFKVKGGRAALLTGGAATAAYGAKKIHDKKDASWQPYAKALGGTPGMGAMRAAPAAAKFKPLGQRPVSANVKNMRKVPLANGGGPSGGGGGGVGNTSGLSGVGKSADFGVFND